MTWQIAVALLGLLVGAGGLAGLVKGRSEGAKIAQEAAVVAQSFYATTIDHQNMRLDLLTKRLDTLEQALRTTEDRARRAEFALADVFAWIDRGAEPPPPERPSWLQMAIDVITPNN